MNAIRLSVIEPDCRCPLCREAAEIEQDAFLRSLKPGKSKIARLGVAAYVLTLLVAATLLGLALSGH